MPDLQWPFLSRKPEGIGPFYDDLLFEFITAAQLWANNYLRVVNFFCACVCVGSLITGPKADVQRQI